MKKTLEFESQQSTGYGHCLQVMMAAMAGRLIAPKAETAKPANTATAAISSIPTFGKMTDEVRKALSAGFRNDKHKAQWKSTLATYAASLNPMPVDTITTDDILASSKPTTGMLSDSLSATGTSLDCQHLKRQNYASPQIKTPVKQKSGWSWTARFGLHLGTNLGTMRRLKNKK